LPQASIAILQIVLGILLAKSALGLKMQRTLNDETIERLELKLAFLERANTELSDVVYRQQRQLDELQQRFAALKDRMEALASQPAAYSSADEKPPHY
jgi:SlyX protein